MLYNANRINLDIYINKSQIDSTDYLNIVQIDPANPTDYSNVIIKISSQDSEDINPSSLVDEKYLFSSKINITTPGNYVYRYLTYDSIGNLGTVSSEFSIDVGLKPQRVSLLNPTQNSGLNTLTFTIGKKTIQPDDDGFDYENPSMPGPVYILYESVNDEDYTQIGDSDTDDSTSITISRTFSNNNNNNYKYKMLLIGDFSNTQSDFSNIVEIEPYAGAIIHLPTYYPENLSVTATTDGKFYVYFTYKGSSQANPTHFNIYASNEDNPSEVYGLDGTIDYSATSNTYRYLSSVYDDDERVSFKVNASTTVDGSVEIEQENTTIVPKSAIADLTGPTVSGSTIVISVE